MNTLRGIVGLVVVLAFTYAAMYALIDLGVKVLTRLFG